MVVRYIRGLTCSSASSPSIIQNPCLRHLERPQLQFLSHCRLLKPSNLRLQKTLAWMDGESPCIGDGMDGRCISEIYFAFFLKSILITKYVWRHFLGWVVCWLTKIFPIDTKQSIRNQTVSSSFPRVTRAAKLSVEPVWGAGLNLSIVTICFMTPIPANPFYDWFILGGLEKFKSVSPYFFLVVSCGVLTITSTWMIIFCRKTD